MPSPAHPAPSAAAQVNAVVAEKQRLVNALQVNVEDLMRKVSSDLKEATKR